MLFLENIHDIRYSHIEEFCALDRPDDQRPREELRIDFKSDFPKDLPKYIVAFANACGGIVLLGVETTQGIPQKICGIPVAKGDTKTRVTEIAYSAINPPIIPEVVSCIMPSDNSREVVVIRIQESQYPPHMVIRGGENSIYHRVNDECRKADLKTIEALFAKRKSAAETFGTLLSTYGDLVELEDTARGFRVITFIPEIPREDMIIFNKQMDWFFLNNKPDLVWLNTPPCSVYKGIYFKGKGEFTGGYKEFRFSVTQEGVIRFSETLHDWENGFGLDQTINVLVKLLDYVKGIYKNFRYYGKVHVRLRAGRVRDKTLTRGGTPMRTSLVSEHKAVADEFSEGISVWVDDIREDNPESCLLLISNFIRGLFHFAVEETATRNLIKDAHKAYP